MQERGDDDERDLTSGLPFLLRVRYTIIGMINAATTPVAVYLGAMMVNQIAEARQQ